MSSFLGLLFLLITIWVYYFFREPERVSINDENYLVSPADGVIVNVSEINGPITVVTSKIRRVTFFECPNDLNSMIDLAKATDLVLLMI